MKLITVLTALHILIISSLIATWLRQNRIEERIAFICSIPIVTDKTVLLARERGNKWVFDADLAKTFYYVPGGCN